MTANEYIYDSTITEFGPLLLTKSSSGTISFFSRKIRPKEVKLRLSEGNDPSDSMSPLCLSKEDIEEVLSENNIENFDTITVTNVSRSVESDGSNRCDICNSSDGSVLKCISEKEISHMNFHKSCLRIIAEEGYQLIQKNSSDIMRDRI